MKLRKITALTIVLSTISAFLILGLASASNGDGKEFKANVKKKEQWSFCYIHPIFCTVSTSGNGSGNEPPVTNGNGSGNEPPIKKNND
jgi:hypothetical protein